MQTCASEIASIVARLQAMRPDEGAAEDHREASRRQEIGRALLAMGCPEKCVEFIVTGKDRRGLAWRETESGRKLRAAMCDPRWRFILLSGPTGTGKSDLAVRAMANRCRQPVVASYVTRDGERRTEEVGVTWAPGRYIRSQHYARIADWDLDLLQGYWRAPVLVVDDLGEETELGPQAVAKLRMLITQRDDASGVGVLTIFTGNLDLQTFAATYHDRALDRMREIGTCIRCDEVVRPGEVQR